MSNWDIKKILSYKTKESFFETNSRDSIIYAMGIGFSKDPLNEQELQYTYEQDPKFKLFPTICCVLTRDIDPILEFRKAGIPEFDPMLLLHGEQSIEIIRPLKVNQKYVSIGNVLDVQDKGKATIASLQLSIYEILPDNTRQLSCKVIFSDFIRKLVGSGFKGTGNHIKITPVPKRQPDTSITYKTTPDQAIIYRLSGDLNPLHIDPVQAKHAGFKQPILHGLCFYGMAARAVSEKICSGDSDKIKKFNCRFTASVFPGESIEFQIWKENDNTVTVAGRCVERNVVVIYGQVIYDSQPKL